MTDKESFSDSVLLGVITSAHGLRGQFKVKSFTDPLENLVQYGSLVLSSGAIVTPKLIGSHKGLLICSAAEITDRTGAESIQRQELRIARDALPPVLEDEIYQADYMGFMVIDLDNNTIGSVIGFHNFGAGDLIEVKPDKAESLFLPFTGHVSRVDLDVNRLVLEVPEGLVSIKPKEATKSE